MVMNTTEMVARSLPYRFLLNRLLVRATRLFQLLTKLQKGKEKSGQSMKKERKITNYKSFVEK